jgi:hypothetical protein
VTIELPAARPDRGSRRGASASRAGGQGRPGPGQPPDQPTIT